MAWGHPANPDGYTQKGFAGGAGAQLGPAMGRNHAPAGGVQGGCDSDHGLGGGGPGCGIWAHLGPSVHSVIQAHGTHGRDRRQPDFQDLALRRIEGDRKNKGTLGRSPAIFGGATPPVEAPRPPTGPKNTEGVEFASFKANNGEKFKKALDIARNPDYLSAAVAEFRDKFFADSNKAPQARRECDVLELATTLAKASPAFPLTPNRVVEFGAALKAAGYKSGEQYLGALRIAHVERDYIVTPALKRAFDLAKRALGRGKGKPDRAPEVQLADFPDDSQKHDLVPGELAFPKLTYGLALMFILRRAEAERLRWEDITLAPDGSQVTVFIRASKTDQAGKGVSRTLGCTCRSDPANCPVELVKALTEAFDRSVGRREGKAWLTSSSEGLQVTEDKLVGAWARAAGRPLKGHSPRRSGTMFYVRAGLSIMQVTYLGRWHSNLVFQYGEEAWEGRPMNRLPHDGPSDPLPLLPPPGEGELQRKHPRAKSKAPPRTAGSETDFKFVEDLGANQPKWVRTSGRSKVVHLLGKHTGGSSATWKTRCGWPFARSSHFTLLVTPPQGVPRCINCRLNVDRSRGKPTGVERAGIGDDPLDARFFDASAKGEP